MSSKIGDCSLNPFKYELNCKTGTAAAIVSAISTIIAIGGVLALLSSLGNMGTIGGSVAVGVGGGILLTTIAWIIMKIKQSRQKTEEKNETETKSKPEDKKPENETPKINYERLNRVFVEKDNLSVQGCAHFKTLWGKEIDFYFTEETTVQDIAEKIAIEISPSDPNPSGFRMIFGGRQLAVDDNKDKKWSEFAATYNADITKENPSTIHIVLRLQT